MAIALFGVAVLVSLSVLHPRGMYLRLDPDGLEMRAFSLKHKTRCRDIQSLEIKSLDARKMIAVNYRPDSDGQRTLRTLNRRLGGMEGAIPDQYQVPLADLGAAPKRQRPPEGGLNNALADLSSPDRGPRSPEDLTGISQPKHGNYGPL